MKQPIDRTGQRFERLTVIARASDDPYRCSQPRWHVRCDCGTEKIVYGTALQSGNTRSCGCLGREVRQRMHAEAEARHPPKIKRVRSKSMKREMTKRRMQRLYAMIDSQPRATAEQMAEMHRKHRIAAGLDPLPTNGETK